MAQPGQPGQLKRRPPNVATPCDSRTGRRSLARVAWLLAVASLTVGCGTQPALQAGAPSTTRATASTDTARTPPPSTRASRSTVPATGVHWVRRSWDAVADTKAGLFLAWQTSSPGSLAVTDDLARASRQTGAILAHRQVPGSVGSILAAAGSLWVTTSRWSSATAGRFKLWRLDPRSLALRGSTWVSGSSMVVAGGHLWLAGGSRLERVDLASGAVTARLALSGQSWADVGTDEAGSVLLVGVADGEGGGHVERRSPYDGALLAKSAALSGVASPDVGAVIDGQIWLSESTGMMGYVQRYRLSTLGPAGRPCVEGADSGSCTQGTNGIRARVANGLVWITDPPGGPRRNACIDPATGRHLAPLPLTGADELMAIGARHLYVVKTNREPEYLVEETTPAACRVGSGS